MATIDHVLATYRFNLTFAQKLVADLSDEQMARQPAPGMNHAAWILGHLTMARLWLKDTLKLSVEIPSQWSELFNTGSKPVAGPGKYPPKAELLAALEKTHLAIDAALRKLTEADLMRETPNERMRQFFPHLGDLLVGLVTSHEGFHLGQLSAWRRAMGLPSVFGGP